MTSSPVRARAEYVSLQDAAAMYGVSVDLLRRRIASGILPAVHAGRRVIRVRLADLHHVFRPIPTAARTQRDHSW